MNWLKLLLAASVLVSCGKPPIFTPQFKVSPDSVHATVNKIVETEKVSIQGYKVPMDDTLDVSSNIQLINPKRLPADSVIIFGLEKKVARSIKGLLKDPFQYNTYRIIFLQRDTVSGKLGSLKSEKGLSPSQFDAHDL